MDGYVTDIITDLAIGWLERRDPNRPFALMVHHKAPHRTWEPDSAHQDMYADVEIPEPPTLFDDYDTRSQAAREAWELYDLVADPLEMSNVHGQPGYDATATELERELRRLQLEVGDESHPSEA